MNVTERRMATLELLHSRDTVEIAELADRFGVSTMTVRRDLRLFERQGLIGLGYGTAYLKPGAVVQEASFTAKSGEQLEQKLAIGQLAADFVKEGETIVVDCGTTPLQLLKHLQSKRVTIITNSMPVASYASGNPKITLIYAPGHYDEISAGLLGELTIEFYHRIRADKVFMGTHGFSVELGATVPEVVDASTKRAVMAAGREKFLLVDSTKFDQAYLMQTAQLSEFDHVITDAALDQSNRLLLEAVCRNVAYANAPAWASVQPA